MKIKFEMMNVDNKRSLRGQANLVFHGYYDMESDFGTPLPDESIPILKKRMAEECIVAMQIELDKAKTNLHSFLE